MELCLEIHANSPLPGRLYSQALRFLYKMSLAKFVTQIIAGPLISFPLYPCQDVTNSDPVPQVEQNNLTVLRAV